MAPRRRSRTWSVVAAALAMMLVGVPADGQDRGPRMASRADLEARIEALQQEMASADRSRQEEIRGEIEAISYRLREGDIWQGDVIALAVAGETDWSADFIVKPRRTLDLPDVDPIPLGGVLYSELEPHLTAELGKYLRQPRVQAEALKRIAVLGGVGDPGFLTTSGSTVVADLIMDAGGPTSTAKLDDAEFRRNGNRVGFDTGPIALQSYSLDELGIRSGDELHVPQSRTSGSFWLDIRTITFGIGGLIILFTRIF